MAFIPYVHKLADTLKNIRSRYNVDVKLMARNKLAHVHICLRANKVIEPRLCSVKHQNKFVEFRMGVVLLIPFPCSKVYVEQ